jgi:hypothetical protein
LEKRAFAGGCSVLISKKPTKERAKRPNPFDFTWRERRPPPSGRRHDGLVLPGTFERSSRWETEQQARRSGADKKRSEAMRGLPHVGKGECRVSGDTAHSRRVSAEERARYEYGQESKTSEATMGRAISIHIVLELKPPKSHIVHRATIPMAKVRCRLDFN